MNAKIDRRAGGRGFVLHAIRVSNDGSVHAADREHCRVQVFTR